MGAMEGANCEQDRIGKKRFMKTVLEEEPEFRNNSFVACPINLKKRIKLGQEPQLIIKLERLNISSFVLPLCEYYRRKEATVKTPGIDTVHSLNPEKVEDQQKSCSKNQFGFEQLEGEYEGKENIKAKGQEKSNCTYLGTIKLKQYCKKCDRIFPGPEHLFKSHLLVHKYLMPYECNMKDCVASFQHRDQYDAHIAEHKKLFEHGCDQCEKRFSRIGALRIHVLRKHCESPQLKFKCAQCTMSFLNRCSLTRHELSHSTLKQYTCEICSMELKSKLGFQRHLSAHYDIRPFRCSKCSKRFICASALECHYSIYHNSAKRFKCHICGMELRYETSLKQHLAKKICLVRGSKLRQFKCAECVSVFCSKRARRTHMVKIHGHALFWKKTPTAELDFKYECPDCEEVFQAIRKRTAHRIEAHGYVVKQHSPAAGTFQCSFPDCNRSFTRKAYRTKHFRKQHGEDNLEVHKVQ